MLREQQRKQPQKAAAAAAAGAAIKAATAADFEQTPPQRDAKTTKTRDKTKRERRQTKQTKKETDEAIYIPAGFHWLRLAFGRGHRTWHQDVAAGREQSPRTHRHTHPSAHAPVSTRIPASGACSLSVSSRVYIYIRLLSRHVIVRTNMTLPT